MAKHPKVHKQFSDEQTVGNLMACALSAVDPTSGKIDSKKAADVFFGKEKGPVPPGLRAQTEQMLDAVSKKLAAEVTFIQEMTEAAIGINAELQAKDGGH